MHTTTMLSATVIPTVVTIMTVWKLVRDRWELLVCFEIRKSQQGFWMNELTFATLPTDYTAMYCAVREDRWNPSTGDWIYCSAPVPQSFNYLAPSPALSAPVATPGYPPYAINAGLYGAAPQLLTVAPPPTTVVMPRVVPAPKKDKGKKKKNSGKYYTWEKFYDEEGRVVWIHADTGKRTRLDPYV